MSGEVPEGWRVAQLAEIATIKTGKTPSTRQPELWGGHVPFVTPSDLSGSAWNGRVERHLTDDGALHSTIAPAGSVLFTCIASIGKACVLTEASAFNQQINACVPSPAIDSDFLFAALKHRTPQLIDMAGTTAVPIINKTTFGQTNIAFPPLEEQRRIAKVLRSLHEAEKSAGDAADQHLSFWEALVDDLIWRPAIEGDGLLTPLAGFIKASDYGVNAPLHEQPDGIAVLRMGNIQHGQIDLANLKWGQIGEVEAAALKLRDGDILFNRTNSRELVGKVALVRGEPDYLYASYLVRLSIDRSVADPYFVFAAMNSRRGQTSIRTIATPGVSQSNISPTNLKKLPFPRYSLERQRDVARLLQDVEAAWLEAKREVEALRGVRNSVTSQLLSGRVRVPA